MRPETQRILRRVVEKANRLEASDFVAQLIEPGWHLKFTKPNPEVTCPTEEARDAFLLTFRFFIVKNEPTSFRGLRMLQEDPDVSEEWKQGFSYLRSAINTYLDTSVGEFEYDGRIHVFSNQIILDTFLYGGLVHANDSEAIARYEKWVAHPWTFAFLQMWFHLTIQKILLAIRYLAALCVAELGGAELVNHVGKTGHAANDE